MSVSKHRRKTELEGQIHSPRFDSSVKAQIIACILVNYISQGHAFSSLLLGSSPLKDQSD